MKRMLGHISTDLRQISATGGSCTVAQESARLKILSEHLRSFPESHRGVWWRWRRPALSVHQRSESSSIRLLSLCSSVTVHWRQCLGWFCLLKRRGRLAGSPQCALPPPLRLLAS